MTGREFLRRWDAWGVRSREWISRRVPTVVFIYPFEILAVLIAALMSVPALLGLSTSAALVALVGFPFFVAWAVLLCVGAGVSAYAMKRAAQEPLASGLTFIGGGFLVYSIALFAASGWGGALAGVAFILLGVMSFLRSLHFRRLTDIQRGATRLPGGDRR